MNAIYIFVLVFLTFSQSVLANLALRVLVQEDQAHWTKIIVEIVKNGPQRN